MEKVKPHSLQMLAFITLLTSSLFFRVYWQRHNYDLDVYLVPWFRHFIDHGRFASLGSGFSNYNPPYLYLLSITTLARALASPETLIRLLSMSFLLFSAGIMHRFARRSGRTQREATWIACIWFIAPEPLLNSWVWGQCDVIYTSALMAAVMLLIDKRSAWAMIMYGVALAFKLQAIFVAPFFLWAALVGSVRGRDFLLTPAVFLSLLVPSAMAGRPWHDLLTIYINQPGTYRQLSLNAPNFWTVVQGIVPGIDETPLYDSLVKAGLVMTIVAVGLFIVRLGVGRRAVRAVDLMTAAVVFAVAVPYMLPLMHERYFFPAAALSFMLAILQPRFVPVAMLIQVSDALSYSNFLHRSTTYPLVGAISMSAAIGLFVWMIGRDPNAFRRPNSTSHAH